MRESSAHSRGQLALAAAAAVLDPFARTCPPFVSFEATIEGDGRLRLLAYSHEDECRLRAWLSSRAARARLLRQLSDALDGLARVAA